MRTKGRGKGPNGPKSTGGNTATTGRGKGPERPRSKSSSSSNSKGSEHVHTVALVPKSERPELSSTDWADGKPLPHLLRGIVHDTIQGVVTDVAEGGKGIVQLRWESVPAGSMPAQFMPQPQLSPLRGLLDAGVSWKLEQAVNVRIRTPTPGEEEHGILPLELVGEQPMSPPIAPTSDGIGIPATVADWTNGVQRALGVSVAGLKGHSGQQPLTLPAEDWEDIAWSSVIEDVPRQFRTKLFQEPSSLFAAWALAVSGRDVVVSGPLTTIERELLFHVTILRHLEVQYRRPTGTAPTALVLARTASAPGLQRILRKAGVNAYLLKKDDLQKKLRLDADVLLGSGNEVLAAAESNPGLLRRVSYVAVDDLTFFAKSNSFTKLLGHLPGHRWGQSVVWTPRRTEDDEETVAAYTHDPAILSLGNSVSNTGVTHEITKASQVSDRIANLVQRYTRIRVLVFAREPTKIRDVLALSDTDGRLTAPDSSPKKVSVVASEEPWAGDGQFDLVVHADPPPSRNEYMRRLACARELAATYVGTEEDGSLQESWISFAEYAAGQGAAKWGGGERLKRLLPKKEERPQRQNRRPRDIVEEENMWAVLEQLETMQKEKEKHTGELPEFQVQEGGTLVWSAGVDDLDTAVAFEQGL